VPTRIPASERTSQKLEALLTQGVADGDARAELLKLAVRKIVEEALEAEVAEAVGREYYENGAAPGAGYRNGYRRGRLRTAEGPIEYGFRRSRIGLSPLCPACAPASRAGPPNWNGWPSRCLPGG
jgi:transposase-like protein